MALGRKSYLFAGKALETRLSEWKSRPSVFPGKILDEKGPSKELPWGQPIDSSFLDDSQREVVHFCLNRDLSFVWDPRGTGKTYTLGQILAIAALAGKRIIATAISDVTVDQISFVTCAACGPISLSSHHICPSLH